MSSKRTLTVFSALCFMLIVLTGCRQKSSISEIFDTPDVPESTANPNEADDADTDDTKGEAKGSFVVRGPSSVTLDQQFYVEYVLSDVDGDEFTPPEFDDFVLLGGPGVSKSSSVQVINGHASSSSSCTYTFALQPKKEGTFELPAATVRVDGKLKKSRTMKITVEGHGGASNSNRSNMSGGTNGGEEDNAPQQPRQTAASGKDLYFTAEVSKRTVYEQEPIMLTYRVHASPNVGLKRVLPTQRPDLKGFWTQEIDLHRRIDGATGICQQFLMFPQQTGKLTIPSVSFGCELVRQGSFDPFDAFFNGGGNMHEMVQRSTEEVDVEVLPLPDKPIGFSGGVGQFSINTQLLTPETKTNDVATLRVTISGKGNLTLVKAPLVQFPEDIDSYEPKMTDKTQLSAEGITGEVNFDYTFVPRVVGQYEIPAADFIYFDTQSRDFVTLHTATIPLDVKKGQRTNEEVESEKAMLKSDINGIHPGSAAALSTEGFAASTFWIGSIRYFFALVLLTAFCVVCALFLRRRVARGADIAGTRNRKARKKANKHLRAAEKALASDDHNAFYAALSQALRGYFADKLTRDAAALTNEVIVAALGEKGLSDELLQQTKALLEDCDFARFAPSASADQRAQDLERAAELLNNIDQNIK